MSQYSQIRRAGLPSIYVYAEPEDLPLVNITAGTIAFIESISGLFIYNNGWRPLSTSEDGPVITAAPLSITVESGTTYTTTIEAYDPDELPIIYGVTTTGSIAENTEVTIDEDTGVLTLLSNNPYADNFSILLTCSDGVFATTRTIPVTITNRLPSFTVEPAASQTASVGTEFSYQYAVTDPDDSTAFEFSLAETSQQDYVNYQQIQRIVRDNHPAWGGATTRGFGLGAATGGDYLVLTPGLSEQYTSHSPVVYKWNNTLSKFEIFQWDFAPWDYTETQAIDASFSNGSASKYCVAVNNDFLFVSQFNADSTWSTGSNRPNKAKVMKYDANTDQFVDWAGGDLISIVQAKYSAGSLEYDNDNGRGIVWHRMKDAHFVTTENGETALLIISDYANAIQFPMCWVMVYNETEDRWEAPLTLGIGTGTNNEHRRTFRYSAGAGSFIDRYINKPRQIVPNPYKNEFVISFTDLMLVVDYTLTPQTVNVGGVDEIQYTGTINDEFVGIGGVICEDTAAAWEDADTLWISGVTDANPSVPDGSLRKIVRGSTPDQYNGSHWLPTETGTWLAGSTNYDLYGSATHTIYSKTGLSYTSTDAGNDDGRTDRLIIKPTSSGDIVAVGSLGNNTFIVNGSTNQVQHLDSLYDREPFATFEVGNYNYGFYSSGANEMRCVLYNRELGLVIAVDQEGLGYDGVAMVYGFGSATSISQDGEVTVKPASFGNYSLTTTVSDSIDSINDTVALSVPGGVNFTQSPPTNKTIDANSTQTFDVAAISGNYADELNIKFSSDLDYTQSSVLTGSTDHAVVENDLFVLVNGEVRQYTLDQFGVPGASYNVLDTSSLTTGESFIENLYAVDDYLILGRKYEASTSPTGVSGRLGGRETTSSWGYVYGSYPFHTQPQSIAYRYFRYTFQDIHQQDTDGTYWLEYTYTSYWDDDGNPTNDEQGHAITIYKYDPIINQIKQVGQLTGWSFQDDQSEAEGVGFIRAYHPDRQSSQGDNLLYLMNRSFGNNGDAEMAVFSYTDDSVTLLDQTFLESDASYNHDGFYADVSSDGEWCAVVYGPSSTGRIWLRGPDDQGTTQQWTIQTSKPNQLSDYNSCGFIKINNEYHLVTLFYDTSNSKWIVQVWELPTSQTPGTLNSYSPVSSYDVLFTDPDGGSIEGPITSNDNNDVVVGSWLFTVSVLTKTLTKHSVLAGTGVSAGAAQRIMYVADKDVFYTYNTPRAAPDGTGSGDLGSSIVAWSLNPITKAFISKGSASANISSSYATGLGVNANGDFITSHVQNGTALTAGLFSRIGKWRYHGSLYGQGALIPFKKENGSYVQKGILTTSDYSNTQAQAPWGNRIGGLLKQDLGDGKDYLTFGYPWYESLDPQGRIYRYYWDTDTSTWIKDTHVDQTYAIGSSGGTSYGHNNFGYSLTQYQDFVMEAGPRNTAEDDNRAKSGQVTLFGNRLGQLITEGIISDSDSLSADGIDRIFYLSGFAENTIANTYIAWGNTGSRGTFDYPDGKLNIFNSVYNNPTVPIETATRFSQTRFRKDDSQTIEAPTGFDYSWNYGAAAGTNDNSGIELTDRYIDGGAKQFDPSGDYTIEFHYKHTSGGYKHILNTATYNGNFFTDADGLRLYMENNTLVFCKNFTGTPPNLTLVKGVYWSNVASYDDTWRHYAIVYDSVDQDFTLWVDGQRQGLGTVGDSSYMTTNPQIWQPIVETNYHWNIGPARSTNGTNSDIQGVGFDFANLIVTFNKEYDPDDATIDLSFFEDISYKKIKPSTWLAIGIGGTLTDLSGNHAVNSRDITPGSAPNTYTPTTINNSGWVRYLDGTDNSIVAANDNRVFVLNRDVDNTFYVESSFGVQGEIKKVKVLSNDTDTVIVQTTTDTIVYNKDLGKFLTQQISVSNGTATISPKLLANGTYTLKTIASDRLGTSIKNTTITQNPVFDISTVNDREVFVEWGSTDTQTLPVSNDYTTTWTRTFTNNSKNSTQLVLTNNSTNYSLVATPSTVTHDKFAVDLTVSLGGETETVSTNTYYTYAPWKLGPTDANDYDGGSGSGWRPLSPDLDGNDGSAADQSYYYGYSVSMSEIDEPNTTGYFVVGQPRSNWDNTGVMTASGEVYVYQWNDSQGSNDLAFVGSQHRQRLQNSTVFGTDTNVQGQHFGWVVDITADGETLLVTAPGIGTTSVDPTANSSAQAGAVVYARQSDGTFSPSTTIDFADITLGGSQLGTAAAISDDASTIVFGSANYPVNTNQNGLVSIWRRNTAGTYTSFSLIDHVTNSWANNSRTGESVAVSADGSVVAIGQPGYNPGSVSGQGAVLVYRYTDTGYQFVQRITEASGMTESQFGYSVAMTPDGGTIVVGAPGSQNTATYNDIGSVWIYDGNTTDGSTRTTFFTENGITGGNGTTGARMGHSVTIDKFGSTIIAGAPYTGASVRDGSRSSNNYEVGRVYTMYKESGTWNTYNKAYIPYQVHGNHIVNPVNTSWRNRTYGWSVCLAPNGSQLAVGDPTLAVEDTGTTNERVHYHQPSKVDLIESLRSVSSMIYSFSNGQFAYGVTQTMGTNSPLVIPLPDFSPTGIASKQDYQPSTFSGSDGVTVSINGDGNLSIAHTRNSSTVTAGYTLISVEVPSNIFGRPDSNSVTLRVNWI